MGDSIQSIKLDERGKQFGMCP